MDLISLRKEYPQYKDMPDDALVDGLHKKFYSDMDKNEFATKVGYTPKEVPKTETFQRTLSPLGQLGVADELYAATAYALGGDYDEAKKQFQEKERVAREANPRTALAGDILSNVGMAVATPTSTIRGGVVAAGALGGLAGFGKAEGDLMERSEAGLMGGVTSAALSGALGSALKVSGIALKNTGKLAGTMIDSFAANNKSISSAEIKAVEKVRRAVVGDEITPDIIEMAIKEGKSIFEVGKRKTKQLAEAAALYPKAQDVTEKFFTKKIGGAPSRLKQDIADFVSERWDFETLADDITKAGRQKAGPLYVEAYKVKPKITQEVREILQTPAGKQAFSNANKLIANERADLKDAPFKFLDYAKQGFDVEINKFKDTLGRLDVRDIRVKPLISLRNQLNEEMKRINPIYGKAVSASGDYISNVEAINKGTNFTKYSPKELKELYGDLSIPERTSFMAGVAGVLRRNIDSATTQNVVRKVTPNETVRQQLQSFLPKGQYEKLIKQVEVEDALYKAQSKIIGNSRTATREIYRKTFENDADFLNIANGLGVTWMGINAVKNYIKKTADGLNDKIAGDIADILYSTDPKKQLSILSKTKAAAKAGDGNARDGLEIYAAIMDATRNILKKSASVTGEVVNVATPIAKKGITVVAPAQITSEMTESDTRGRE